MADCRRFQDDLKAYCDQELSWPRRLQVRRHLNQCVACRQEMKEMTQIAEDLRASEETNAPLDTALRDKILADAGTAASTPLPIRRSRRPYFALAAAAVILVGWFALHLIFNPPFGVINSLEGPDTPEATTLAPASPAVGEHVLNSASKNMALNRLPITFATRPAHSAQSVVGAIGGPNVVDGAIPDDEDVTTRQVHNEASIGVQVDDPEAKSDQVAQMATDAGGYVAENDLTTANDGTKSAELTLNVPVAEFPDVLAQIAKLGNVQSKSITGQDITDKTSDAQQAESVLEQEMSGEEAHLAKLGKHAKWEDEENAREVRVDLAQARARLVLLRKLGRLSSIDVTLTGRPTPPPPAQTGFLHTLSGTTQNAAQSLLASAASLLALLIWLLAYAPIWIPLLLIARTIQKRYWPRSMTPTP